MESLYMKHLIRTVGKSYKDIYNEKGKYGEFTGVKDLINKYVSMEKVVLYDHKHWDAQNDSDALTIVYHGTKRDFGGKLHLQFDENYPILHLISYETDVADYNIKTHTLFMGATYSPTTEGHMDDFNCLFGFNGGKVMNPTGKLVHEPWGTFHEGLPTSDKLTSTAEELNLVSSYSQVPLFDELFMSIATYGKTYKVFKYQYKQMTQIILGAFNMYDDGSDQLGMADSLLHNELTYSVVLKGLVKLYKLMDSNMPEDNKYYHTLTQSVDVNSHYGDKGLYVRNLDKSFEVLKNIIKGLLMRHHVFDQKVSA